MNMDERIAALDASIGVAEAALVAASGRYETTLRSKPTRVAMCAAYKHRERARNALNALIDVRLDETSIQRAGWSVVENCEDGEDFS